MKLWQKGEEINKLFEQFTIGKDPELDLEIAPFDVTGSMAHVKMLGKIGLLEQGEVESLLAGLQEIAQLMVKGEFVIEQGIEDCHSQIELMLTRKLGDVGKKVHAGRSRNDQVLTALKLYTRANILELVGLITELFGILIKQSESNKEVIMPGYTHMQVAMPSSFGLWFGAYAESLVDDLIWLKAAYEISNKNPLGSAAGYGASFPLDRNYTTNEMDFAALNVNVVYAQMTRGKLEKSMAQAVSIIAGTLSKLAMDVCLFSGQDFKFFQLPVSFTTGSSIMPHKHNPDGFELVRGKCNALQSLPNTLSMVLTNLPSGYHRDLQVLKENYIPAIKTLKDCLQITCAMVDGLRVNDKVIAQSKYDLLFTVEEVNKLVLIGVPFRDAYRQVGEQIKSGSYSPNYELEHTHIGSIGNLGNDLIRKEFEKIVSTFN